METYRNPQLEAQYKSNLRGYKKYLKDNFNTVYKNGELPPFGSMPYAAFLNVERRDYFEAINERIELLTDLVFVKLAEAKESWDLALKRVRNRELNLLVNGLQALDTESGLAHEYRKFWMSNIQKATAGSITGEVKMIEEMLNK